MASLNVRAGPVETLAILAPGPVSGRLEEALRALGAQLRFTASLGEAERTLRERPASVILLDRCAAEEDWRDAVSRLAHYPYWSCVILLSPVTDAYLWEEVVRHGGYDVAAASASAEELERMIRRAWRYWRSKRELKTGASK
ncbi:MAG: hypothetical protein NTZ98_22630 [Acidobacteria bacterium]|nr:hypothetical protein [Acidobacteriota bacterium]